MPKYLDDYRWKGRRIADLSRDQLIRALAECLDRTPVPAEKP